MSIKERLRVLGLIFEETGIERSVFEKIEDKCVSMSHLGFPESDMINRLNEEVKKFIEDNEKYSFNFVNIAEKYDFDVEFLD